MFVRISKIKLFGLTMRPDSIDHSYDFKTNMAALSEVYAR